MTSRLAALTLLLAAPACAAPFQAAVKSFRPVASVKAWAPATVYGSGTAPVQKLAVGPLHLAPNLLQTQAPEARLTEQPLETLRLTAQEKIPAKQAFDGSLRLKEERGVVPGSYGRSRVRLRRYNTSYWTHQSHLSPYRGVPTPKDSIWDGVSVEDAWAAFPLAAAAFGSAYTVLAMTRGWIEPQTGLLLTMLFGSLTLLKPSK